MAWLGEDITAAGEAQQRSRTDEIEEALYAHRRSLFGELAVAFFDTTSLYFEGRGGATLGQRGYSKDFRPQLNQVVLGIVLDEKDRPIASFPWPGNTADVTTLLPVIERLRQRFGVGRICVVADRGMISAATIAEFEAQRIDYILGVRERSSVGCASKCFRMTASRHPAPEGRDRVDGERGEARRSALYRLP
jgi:transposase